MTSDSLAVWCKHDPDLKPPYSFSQISATAISKEISKIYNDSGPKTRECYDLAQDTSGQKDNWIIAWMLWHAFRHSDKRNNVGTCVSRNNKNGFRRTEGPCGGIGVWAADTGESVDIAHRASGKLT